MPNLPRSQNLFVSQTIPAHGLLTEVIPTALIAVTAWLILTLLELPTVGTPKSSETSQATLLKEGIGLIVSIFGLLSCIASECIQLHGGDNMVRNPMETLGGEPEYEEVLRIEISRYCHKYLIWHCSDWRRHVDSLLLMKRSGK